MRKPVGPQIAEAVKGKPVKEVAMIFLKAIEKYESYAVRYDTLTSQPPEKDPSAKVRSNPLLEVFAGMGRYCNDEKISGWELFGVKPSWKDVKDFPKIDHKVLKQLKEKKKQSSQRLLAAALAEYSSSDLEWRDVYHNTLPPGDYDRRTKAQIDMWVSSDDATKLNFAHALSVSEYGGLNPLYPAAKLLDFMGSKSSAPFALVALADAVTIRIGGDSSDHRQIGYSLLKLANSGRKGGFSSTESEHLKQLSDSYSSWLTNPGETPDGKMRTFSAWLDEKDAPNFLPSSSSVIRKLGEELNINLTQKALCC